jgi:hypothetical protein
VFCEVGYPAVFPDMREQETFARLLVDFLADPPENLDGAVWCELYDMHETRAREASHRIYGEEPEREARYVAQLRSLGLSMVDGTPKLAWYVVRDAGLGSP